MENEYLKINKNWYRVVMLGVNEEDNIIIDRHLTRQQAEELLNECIKKDTIHYYEILSEGEIEWA